MAQSRDSGLVAPWRLGHGYLPDAPRDVARGGAEKRSPSSSWALVVKGSREPCETQTGHC